MEKWKRRSIDLLTALVFGGREDMSVVQYYPQKTRISDPEDKYFPRTIPEKKGISSRRIHSMLCELERERRANMHSIKVLRGGEVICECCAPGYDDKIWHVAHSMSKTVTGMVIGRLWDDGLISTEMRLVDIFPEVQYRDKKFPLITVDHLLSMTSGVEFAEVGSITESSWMESFFASTVKFAPGSKFSYNSMNTYVLARIAERVSGRKFLSLAEEYIFAPTGIKNYLWEIGPEGSEKGGWGLYLSSESWVRLGFVILRGGVFEGRRILSSEWVRLSTSVKSISPRESGSFNYAYQTWVGRNSEEILFSGMLGQNVWVCPKNDIVVVMNGGNNEIFQASPALEIVRKYLGGRIDDKLNYRDSKLLAEKHRDFFNCRRWARPLEKKRGLLYSLGIRSRTPFDSRWSVVLGKYALASNGVGMLPLIVRAMQNSLNSSLEELSFTRMGDELVLEYRESGENFRIPIGLYEYKESIIDVRGERYLVRALAEAAEEAVGREYRIELIFPETASTRRLIIRGQGRGRKLLKMSETPNERLAIGFLKEYMRTNGVLSFTVEAIERRFGRGSVEKTIAKTFNPTLILADTNYRGYERIINEENKRANDEQEKVKFIRAFVDRFFK